MDRLIKDSAVLIARQSKSVLSTQSHLGAEASMDAIDEVNRIIKSRRASGYIPKDRQPTYRLWSRSSQKLLQGSLGGVQEPP